MPYLIGDFPVPKKGGGFPDITTSMSYTIIDNGETSKFWKIAFPSTSGNFTLNKPLRKVTVSLQGGGGGGGASNGSTVGSDGSDGTINTFTINLAEGNYSLGCGAGGARGYNSAGSNGGSTAIILPDGSSYSAAGGAGGARAGGNRNQTHTSIYTPYGAGGLGGTTSQYTTSTSGSNYKYVYTLTSYAYKYNKPSSIDGWNMGTVYAGESIYLKDLTVYSNSQNSRETFYMTEDGCYIATGKGTAEYKATSTTTNYYYYGVAGNAGVIVLSGAM